MCEIDIGNPKYTTFTKLVQVQNFITFDLKVIWHEERETLSFYADCFNICPKPCEAPHLQTTGLASAGPESQPSRSDTGTQLTAFSQIPKILSPCFWFMMSFTPPGHISYLGFYFDICEWHILPVKVLVIREIQTVSIRIWTQVSLSISYNYHYIMNTFIFINVCMYV